MGKFHFGCGNGKVSAREESRINKILKKIGRSDVDFVAVDAIGIGTRYWFSAPNMGAPFDGDTAREVMQAVGAIKTA